MNKNNDDLMYDYLEKYLSELENVISINKTEEEKDFKEKFKQFILRFHEDVYKFETDETWASFVVRRVFNNRRKTFFDTCMYYFLTNIYLVDMCTTKESLYNLVLKDIGNIRDHESV